MTDVLQQVHNWGLAMLIFGGASLATQAGILIAILRRPHASGVHCSCRTCVEHARRVGGMPDYTSATVNPGQSVYQSPSVRFNHYTVGG
jgi:hypothetical protein